MDHVDAVLDGNFDDLVASQVGSDGRVLAAGANLVGLVGLLPVHAEAVLMTVDCDSVQRQLVGGTEDSDGDFSSVGDWAACQRGQGAREEALRGSVPSSFFSCMMELLARSLWCTEFLWGWCSPCSSSKSLSSMALEAFLSMARAAMVDGGGVY
jgi:hypothetical protein